MFYKDIRADLDGNIDDRLAKDTTGVYFKVLLLRSLHCLASSLDYISYQLKETGTKKTGKK